MTTYRPLPGRVTACGWSSDLRAVAPDTTQGPSASCDKRRKLAVMIVEDEFVIAMDLEMQVEAAGHDVVATARTADAAVTEARRTRPDVVLMDLRLADGSSGIDAARDLYDGWRIRCVFLSGNLDAGTRERVAAFEPLGMLSKPVTPTQLRKALDGLA